MLFGKKENSLELDGKKIVVVGVSSTALFLAAECQEKGAKVEVLGARKKCEMWQRKGAFQVKRIGFQSKWVNLKFVCRASFKPDFYFVASEPQGYMADLTLIDKSCLDVPIANFASFGNQKLIDRLGFEKVIKVYFNGYLVSTKNTITQIGKILKAEIAALNDSCAEQLKGVLDVIGIETLCYSDKESLYWQKKIPFVVANLLACAFDEDVGDVLVRPEICSLVGKAVREWCNRLKDKNIFVDGSAMMPDIYAFASGYKSEFGSPKGIEELVKMIEVADKFETADLYDLMMLAVKKF